jgi:hypothetical protein
VKDTYLKKQVKGIYEKLKHLLIEKDIKNLFFDIETTAWQYAHEREKEKQDFLSNYHFCIDILTKAKRKITIL